MVAAGSILPTPARAQRPADALRLAPPEVRYAVRSADEILSTPDSGVGLESFDSGVVTGVYLIGLLADERESIGYGKDAAARRYLWFSVGRGDSIDYVVMTYDVDHDLRPEFLMFHTVDKSARAESIVEYRAPSVVDLDFGIEVQPACQPPRCDPSTWTRAEREVVVVSADWFDPWRTVYGMAAMRGERWLGKPVESVAHNEVPAP
ncbi:MAG TPA: hypothetical protein VJ788_05695 [Gemmatimonadota bacterium]|nr:hypothetical protein [Gemmatimonadota bacterium]